MSELAQLATYSDVSLFAAYGGLGLAAGMEPQLALTAPLGTHSPSAAGAPLEADFCLAAVYAGAAHGMDILERLSLVFVLRSEA